MQSSTRSSLKHSDSSICWIAIWALIIITVGGILAHLGKVLNVLFPLGAFAVGILLYCRNQVLYLGFNWWVWCLAALIRRLADFYGGFTDPSPILLAPYLVTSVCFWTMLRYLPQAKRLGGLAFVLASAGVFYGFLIGLVAKGQPFTVFRGTLDWFVPIPFGFYLLVHWKQYPKLRQNTYRVFTWLSIVMGIYGINQFVSLPEWDRSWLVLSALTSAGNPNGDEGVRIWSTMQSGEPFSAFMAGLLLVLLISTFPLSLPASIVGYLSFLLTLVRSDWLGWAAGLLALVVSLKAKFQMRLIVIAILLGIAVVPIAAMEEFSDRIVTRLNSLTDVKNDTSAKGRQADFGYSINQALLSVVGEGIGRDTKDNNLLAMLFYLGWIGSSLYISGFILLLLKGFKDTDIRLDPFIGVSRAVAMTVIIRIPVNGSLLGVSGMLLWGFLAFAIAATKFHRYQQANQLNN